MPALSSLVTSLLLGFATGMFAIGSKLFSSLAVQTFGIRLIGTGFGDRFLVVRARGVVLDVKQWQQDRRLILARRLPSLYARVNG